MLSPAISPWPFYRPLVFYQLNAASVYVVGVNDLFLSEYLVFVFCYECKVHLPGVARFTQLLHFKCVLGSFLLCYTQTLKKTIRTS